MIDNLYFYTLDVNEIECDVEFYYWPAEGDGWNSPYMDEEFEIVSCYPDQPNEDIIEALKNIEPDYDYD